MTLVAGSPAVAGTFLDELTQVVEEVRAGASARDRERTYAVAEVERLRATGFWAATVPVEHGGLGLDAATLVQAVLLLAGADGSLGQVPQNHFMTVERIRLAARPDQRRRWLALVGSGAVLGNATAEPGERPPGESASALRRAGDAWVLEARKVYSTGSLLADHIAVQARDEEGRQRTALVARDAPGVEVVDDWQSIGQRTTASGSSVFRGVRVADVDVLDHAVAPVATYRISALGQLLHAAIDAGIAVAAVDETVALARRVHAGRGAGVKEFGDDQLGVALVGDLSVQALAARRLVESAAARLSLLHEASPLEEVVDTWYEVAAAKLVSTRAALAVTAGLFEVGGASSTHPDHGHDRYWRDARTHTLHDAVRWKPHAIGRWRIARDVGDPWSIGHPFRPLDELRSTP
ncbi:acyl-CoA dehydrogenase family protein [Nocardioides sp. SYSU D00038]|uniref:acyl-CoA dehydrogenase family protein n=1 Tax=Nocardioides sp. SYSU D00038 TaxID=2812554 RepID=UPI0019676AAA|nr:acyl-CoA dehydrogenase family protein [Nocardioides sp. SYSU D00038]